MKGRKTGTIVFIVIMGLVLGAAFGQLIAWVLPDSPVKSLFLKTVNLMIQPFLVNLVFLEVTFGFTLKLNLLSIITVFVLAYLLKWML
jgi:hypothetical protein